MHAYSVEFPERKHVPFYLAAAATAIIYPIQHIIVWLGFAPDLIVYVPTGFAAYGFMYYAFDRWLWSFGILRMIGVVKTPNVGGVWKGTLKSSNSEMTKDHQITVTISQTWSTIRIVLETSRSISRSGMATIRSETPTSYDLRWEYRAEAKYPDENSTFNHRGMSYLRLIIESGVVQPEMSGNYYTQSSRDTHGAISLIRHAS